VSGEVLPLGTGEPDQAVRLTRTPVLPGSVRLTVDAQAWQETDDLLTAGPEVPVPDLRLPPGAAQPPTGPTNVYAVDPEAGVVRFGDGLRGRRPPPQAKLRADYDYGLGGAGNVGRGAITTGSALPPGFTVTNPVRTWGGVDAETVAEGEKQIPRYLQHRDRLVTAADFEAITRRTPGVEIARVEVLSAFDPQLAPNLPGGAPGAVTLMIVPRHDPVQPDAPRLDRFVLDAVCAHLEPRRLVTTELILRGPEYVPVLVSVGVDVAAGTSVAEVARRVEAELRRVLSPLPLDAQRAPGSTAPTYAHAGTGWPLRTPVSVAELTAVVTRVNGVRVVNGLLLGGGAAPDPVALAGLQLPLLAGVAVTPGDPLPLDRLRGTAPADAPPSIPVPVVPEGC
jgi:predicted phage baseplate assembly protein